MRWGLIPYWAKDASFGAKTINAVSETAAEKPAFRDPMRKGRCLIPADGFYEWKAIGPEKKQPYNIGMADGGLFAFAGLWDKWRDAAGEVIESCTILTTEANALLRPIHDRMPVNLARTTMTVGSIQVLLIPVESLICSDRSMHGSCGPEENLLVQCLRAF
jgi:putative SOS response-associated peptidase YedK